MADPLRSLAPYLAYSYLSLVGWTSRIRWEGMENLRAAQAGGGFIYAFWHSRQALFTYTHRNKDIRVLVSRSRDGEIIAKTMGLSRIGVVRGSSSRGAASATRELLDALAAGTAVGITPDGPRGPAGQVKPGALFLALKSGRPILPISNAVSRRLELAKAWDRFQVPLPCARVCVLHGRPIRVREGEDIERRALELKAELDLITSRAESLVR